MSRNTPRRDRGRVDDGRTVTIRLAPDGRVLFHDLTPELLPIALQLGPADGALLRRRHAAEMVQEDCP